MFVFLANGEIADGKQPALTGNQVIGVFLTRDDGLDEIIPYLKNCVSVRMTDINPKEMKLYLLDASRKYHSQNQLRNE